MNGRISNQGKEAQGLQYIQRIGMIKSLFTIAMGGNMQTTLYPSCGNFWQNKVMHQFS